MFHKIAAVSQKLSPGLRKVILNIGWLSVERLLTMILSLFVGVYVVRYLGAENFGKLSYSVSLVTLFSAIAKLGLDAIAVRNIVREEESTQEILGTAFTLKLFGSLIAIISITSTIWFINNDPQIRWISIIISLGLIFDAFEVIDFWLQSKILSGEMAIVRSIQTILSSALKLVFVIWKLPLMAFVWLTLADFMLRTVGMIWVYYKHSQSIFVWKMSLSRAIDMLKDSWPQILATVMTTIYMKIDQVMLGNMVSNQEVGYYAAAVRFSEIWYFVPLAICSSVFPIIAGAKQRSEKEYYGKLQQLYDFTSWVALSIAIPMTFISTNLMNSLLGEEYSQAGAILSLHIWAGPFVFLAVARGQWLITENLLWLNFVTTSLGAITNIILNLFFIPAYGGWGAALATVISYAVASHLACLLYPPMFHTGWMLTKALFIPFRIRQNLIYLSSIKKILF